MKSSLPTAYLFLAYLYATAAIHIHFDRHGYKPVQLKPRATLVNYERPHYPDLAAKYAELPQRRAETECRMKERMEDRLR